MSNQGFQPHHVPQFNENWGGQLSSATLVNQVTSSYVQLVRNDLVAQLQPLADLARMLIPAAPTFTSAATAALTALAAHAVPTPATSRVEPASGVGEGGASAAEAVAGGIGLEHVPNGSSSGAATNQSSHSATSGPQSVIRFSAPSSAKEAWTWWYHGSPTRNLPPLRNLTSEERKPVRVSHSKVKCVAEAYNEFVEANSEDSFERSFGYLSNWNKLYAVLNKIPKLCSIRNECHRRGFSLLPEVCSDVMSGAVLSGPGNNERAGLHKALSILGVVGAFAPRYTRDASKPRQRALRTVTNEDGELGFLAGLACYRLDRLGRNGPDLLNIKSALSAAGLNFLSANENEASHGPLFESRDGGTSSLAYYFRSFYAEYERKNSSMRTKDALKHLKHTGKCTSRIAPRGEIWTADLEGVEVMCYNTENLRNETQGKVEIARKLNEAELIQLRAGIRFEMMVQTCLHETPTPSATLRYLISKGLDVDKRTGVPFKKASNFRRSIARHLQQLDREAVEHLQRESLKEFLDLQSQGREWEIKKCLRRSWYMLPGPCSMDKQDGKQVTSASKAL
ncbi:hypothetical protein HDU93_007011 [Gonapodya sp. JEL0774]|nr:hypothetical protein HDU93_007011 [Gonapodya sp. JEL0774]